jgi:hypothetical protein
MDEEEGARDDFEAGLSRKHLFELEIVGHACSGGSKSDGRPANFSHSRRRKLQAVIDANGVYNRFRVGNGFFYM